MENQQNPNIEYKPQDYDPLGGISSPDELRNVLIGFMGQTYTEVSKFDKHLVSPNVTLRPKGDEFKNIAEKLLSEANNVYGNKPPQQKNNTVTHHNLNTVVQGPQLKVTSDVSFVNQTLQNTQPYVDPNQLEFSFDNSATAVSIQRKLEDIMLKLCSIQDKIDKLNPKPSEY